MGNFICTISASGLHNWDICKEIGAWGIATNGMKVTLPDVKPGDRLFIYRASKGLIATATVTDKIRIPIDRSEAPWAGGLFRYGALVPFSKVIEFEFPVKVVFEKMRILNTAISVTALRRGFSSITESDANELISHLKRASKDT
jgi:hypothetical protein